MLFKETKKKPVLQLAAMVLIIAVAIIVGACPEDDPWTALTTTQNGTPVLGDFNVDGLTAFYDGSSKEVTITPKDSSKSQGDITVHYTGDNVTYNKSSTGPSAVGEYTVTFEVAAAAGWNAAEITVSDKFKIRSNVPTADDFTYSGFSAIVGGTINVTISPKAGSSNGAQTIYYEGINDTSYSKSETKPSTATVGDYKVTFDVAVDAPWVLATGLIAAETLEIRNQSGQTQIPAVGDFNFGDFAQTYDGTIKPVTITRKDSTKSDGAITIHYTPTPSGSVITSPDAPVNAGTYTVTFDVAVSYGWDSINGLASQENLVIAKATPIVTDFNITGVPTGEIAHGSNYADSITIQPLAGKSDGTPTVYYTGTGSTSYPISSTPPTATGTYAVTFDVAASTDGNWNTQTGLSAGSFSIGEEVEQEINYDSTLSWGNRFAPTTLTLQPGNTTEEVRLNWYSSGAATSKVAHVRFIRGTLIAGYELITVTNGTAAAASSGNTYHKAVVTGLTSGASYVYAVSNDGTNWSNEYDFKVPAATGPFKFAVIADPQINDTSWDSNNRYTPTAGARTEYGWAEAMTKIVAKGASFIASAGDQVDNLGGANGSSESEYTKLFAPAGMKSLPFAPVSGNHDNHLLYNYHYNWNGQGTASTTTGRSYYYLYNNILFVVLNTGTYSPTSQAAGQTYTGQNGEFRTTINMAKAVHEGQYDWLIVQHHKSTASVAVHLADADIQFYVEGGFETLMSEMGVDFVLAGHDHVYARSYPLVGKAGGQVSAPNKSFPAASGSIWHNPGDPIYLTFTTASGLKYYAVAPDPYFAYPGGLYNPSNATYPYLGEITGNFSSTAAGSTAYNSKNYLPVSNAAFVQPYIPSYCIVEVDGKSITFSTYPIASKTGQNGSSLPYTFDADVPYDSITVTKD